MKNTIFFFLGICFSAICSFAFKPLGTINGEVQIADKKVSIMMENDHIGNIYVTRADTFIEKIQFYGGGRLKSVELKEGPNGGGGKYFYDYSGPLYSTETYYYSPDNPGKNKVEEITIYKTSGIKKSFRTFIDYKKNGKFEMFDLLGNIIVEGYYIDDVPTGKWKYYYEGKEFEITK